VLAPFAAHELQSGRVALCSVCGHVHRRDGIFEGIKVDTKAMAVLSHVRIVCRIQMLDAVRYMIVWNPIILFGLHLTLHMFGVKPHALGDTSHGGSAANSTLGANGTALVLNLTSAAVNASTRLTTQ